MEQWGNAGDAGKQQNAKRARGRRTDVRVKMPENLLSDAVLRAVVDECIVPALVDRYLRDHGHAADSEQSKQ